MSRANIYLEYTNLAQLIEYEINKRDIEVISYLIKVKNLTISKSDEELIVSTDIISKWNASFHLKAIPLFTPEINTLKLKDIELKLTSKNILFRGVLSLIKNNLLKRIEEMSNAPLTPFIAFITNMLDEEIEKAKLPYQMTAQSSTKKLELKEMEFGEDQMTIVADIEQQLDISFADIIEPKYPA